MVFQPEYFEPVVHSRFGCECRKKEVHFEALKSKNLKIFIGSNPVPFHMFHKVMNGHKREGGNPVPFQLTAQMVFSSILCDFVLRLLLVTDNNKMFMKI